MLEGTVVSELVFTGTVEFVVNCGEHLYLLGFLYPAQLLELTLGQLKKDMAPVWHRVCLLEPLQRGTLPPECTGRMTGIHMHEQRVSPCVRLSLNHTTHPSTLFNSPVSEFKQKSRHLFAAIDAVQSLLQLSKSVALQALGSFLWDGGQRLPEQ